MAWIIGIIILVLAVIVVLRWPKKQAPKSELMAFAESYNQGVFPKGKADQDEGAQMVYDIVGGAIPLDECREAFIKLAIRASMGLNVIDYLERLWGDRIDTAQRNCIAGYLAIRLLAIASGPGTVIKRHSNGVISYGPE